MLQRSRSRKASSLQAFPRYLELCATVSRQLKQGGLEVAAVGPSAEARFLSHSDPSRVLLALRTYSELLQSQLDAGESLRDDKRLLWRMLTKMGYVPRSDIFDAIESGDVIEIFTDDNWQVFRNMAYFDLVRITVDELATLRWSRDYKRPLAFLLACIRLGLMFKSGLIRTTQPVPMDRHEIQIHAGGVWQKFSIQLKMISPLKKGRFADAFILTSDPRPLAETPA